MPKKMSQQTKTMSDKNGTYTFLFLFVIALVILSVLYFWVLDDYMDNKFRKQQEELLMSEPPIEDATELEETSEQLDETNIDTQIDIQLNSLQDEIEAVEKQVTN